MRRGCCAEVEETLEMGPEQAVLFCPLARTRCHAGRVFLREALPNEKEAEEGDKAGAKTEPSGRADEFLYCAFWHIKENRCVLRMAEFDLFNVARSLDEMRNR